MHADYRASSGQLAVAFEDGVLRLGIDRPGHGNALTYALLDDLARIATAAGDDDAVRAVVLAGRGADFSCGEGREGLGDWPERYANRSRGGPNGPGPIPEQEALRALRHLLKPTIACIRGRCLGLAFDLAAVCDLRCVTPDATLGCDRILRGEPASTGITYVLPRLIGQSQAMRLLLSGELIDGREAVRIQFAHYAFDAAAFDAQCDALAARIAALPTRSWEVHKAQVLPQLDLGFEASLGHCLGIRQTWVIEDLAEGMKAWREKRRPRFTGR
jgi:enoyl-CoA hydratase/carnithine racemase